MKAISASIIVLAGAVIFNNHNTELFGLVVGLIGFLAWAIAMIGSTDIQK